MSMNMCMCTSGDRKEGRDGFISMEIQCVLGWKFYH